MPKKSEQLDIEAAEQELHEYLYSLHQERMEPRDQRLCDEPILKPVGSRGGANALWMEHADSLEPSGSSTPEPETGPLD